MTRICRCLAGSRTASGVANSALLVRWASGDSPFWYPLQWTMVDLFGSHTAPSRPGVVFNCLSSRGEEFPLPIENPMDVGCDKCILTIFATHTPHLCQVPGLMPGGQSFVLISLSWAQTVLSKVTAVTSAYLSPFWTKWLHQSTVTLPLFVAGHLLGQVWLIEPHHSLPGNWGGAP